ncbi:hypothetical protein SAE01_01460 [Segetibacter aerophilus]|uniref:Uncharacterized protein n=1 Tax=Segetibacter aerophilus TaxID=670293 RepID=A0A512B6R5_9BACT|nr:hypothetical protein SAE01_01460 [Segetibacter aerophilus]
MFRYLICMKVEEHIRVDSFLKHSDERYEDTLYSFNFFDSDIQLIFTTTLISLPGSLPEC